MKCIQTYAKCRLNKGTCGYSCRYLLVEKPITKVAKKKKVFPNANLTRIPKWFNYMFECTLEQCPTARTFPELLAYRAYLLGKATEKYPADYTK